MRSCLSILTLLLLSACAAKPYVEPPAGSGATLKITNASKDAAVSISSYGASENCRIEDLASVTALHSPDRRLNPGESLLVRIPEELPFTIDASVGNSYSGHCEVVATFTPAKRASYVATFENQVARCYLSVRRFEGGGAVREPSLRQRQKVSGITNNMNACR